MEEFKFNSEGKAPHEKIGISSERHDEMSEIAKGITIRAFFTDTEIKTRSQAYEMFLNSVQPVDKVEAFWAGMIFQNLESQVASYADKMENFLAAAIGKN